MVVTFVVVFQHKMLQQQLYCELNISFWIVWHNHQLNRCFIDTTTNGVLLLWMTIAGGAQLISTRHTNSSTLSWNLSTYRCILYGLQIIVHLFNSFIISIGTLIINWQLHRDIYGVDVFRATSQCLLWAFALVLIRVECNRSIQTTDCDRHGLVLLIFWTGNMIDRCMLLSSIWSTWIIDNDRWINSNIIYSFCFQHVSLYPNGCVHNRYNISVDIIYTRTYCAWNCHIK